MKRTWQCALIGWMLSVGLNTNAQQPTAPTVTVVPGTVGAAVDVGRSDSLSVRSEAVACTAPTPDRCPSPAALSGVADLSEAWSAERMHGRTIIVRNDGPGVLALRVQEPASAPHWRIAHSRVLAAGESAVLTYDGPSARWKISGAVAPILPPPGTVR